MHKTVKTIFIILLIDLFSFTTILPLYPRVINHYISTDKGALLGFVIGILTNYKRLVTKSVLSNIKLDVTLIGGLVGSIFSLCQCISSYPIGIMADKYGRKTALLITLVINLIACSIWTCSTNFTMFLISRIIGGLSEGNAQLSISIINDVALDENRSYSLAFVGIAFSIAFTIGPAIGALSLSFYNGDNYPNRPYFNAALLSTLLIVVEIAVVCYCLEETLVKSSNKSTKKALPAIKYHKITNLFFINFWYLTTFSGIEFTIPFLAYQLFSYTSQQQGFLFMYIGVLSFGLQGIYVRRKLRSAVYNKEKRIAINGLISLVLCLVCFSLSPIYNVVFYVGVTFLSITSALVVTGLTTILSQMINNTPEYKNCKASIQGKYRAYGQLGRVVGPVTYCSLYWFFSPSFCYLVALVSSLGLAAVVYNNVELEVEKEL